ncbi:MAG: ferrous iron transport protein A [Cyclobacteriaceae bacterium]|nr:ferrous iron transport protein A [Cyclobacteriaceae bacterium]
MGTLQDLRPGKTARVIGLDKSCQGFERFRLLDLGVVPGTEITHALDNPLHEPLAYFIRGAVIALRKEQAAKILIEVKE